jgi:hypothetical protein
LITIDCPDCEGEGTRECECCYGDGRKDCCECMATHECQCCEGTGEKDCDRCHGRGTLETCGTPLEGDDSMDCAYCGREAVVLGAAPVCALCYAIFLAGRNPATIGLQSEQLRMVI